MKLLLGMVAVVVSLSALCGCAHNNQTEQSIQTTGQSSNSASSQEATTEPGQQVMEVKPPQTGHNSNFQNQGAPSAAKMISPLTQ